MKKIFSVIVCLIACVSASAGIVNKTVARQNAEQFLAHQGIEMNIKDAPYEYKVADLSDALLYVYADQDGTGFVVVSSTDNTENVLGYSESGQFDPQNIPSNMQGWLEGVTRQIEYARAHGLVNQASGYPYPAIDKLCSSTWNQDAPYNAYAPTVNGQRCPTGCIATAVAQIMYYHKWPESCPSISGYTAWTHNIYRPTLPETTFDWNAMKDTYGTNSTDGDEVAKLMNYVGQSVQMNFSPEGSGASDSYCPYAFKNIFNYYTSVRRVERAGYSVSQWDELVYNELKNGRPVLYCGYTPNWEGHAFVCDGYDGNGFYHINWGWGGYGDGFYRLSVLNPGNTTSSGAASTDDGFTNGQTVVIGIQKEGPDNTLQLWPLKSMTYNSSTKKVKFTIEAIQLGNHEINMANIGADGEITPIFTTTERNFTRGNSYSTEYDLSVLPSGSYNLYAIIRKKGESNWTRVGSISQYAEVTVNSGSIDVILHPITDLEVTKAYFPNAIVAGKDSKMNIDVKNRADEYTGTLYVFTGSDGELKTKSGNVEISMLPGEEFTVSATVKPSTVNNLTIGVTTDSQGKNVLYQHTYYNYVIGIDSYSVTWDPCVVTIKLKNESSIDYNDNIYATFYQNGQKKALGTMNKSVFIPANGTGEVVFELAFTSDKKYYATLQYMQNELTTTKKKMDGQVNIEYDENDAAGIMDVTIDEPNAEMYNISGQKVGKDYKGIVIRNGRKYVK